MKKGMLFGLSHREKRVKKMILELPEPSTDYRPLILSKCVNCELSARAQVMMEYCLFSPL